MRVVWITCALCLLLAGFVAGRSPDTAIVLATTGGSNGTTVPATYQIPQKVANLYLGQYALKTAAHGARLSAGQMAIDFNALGYLQGVASFRGYDTHGFPTNWVAALYNFHLTAPNRMIVDVQSPLGTTTFGKMYLRRTTQGDLVGQIALPKIPYTIQFHRTIVL